MERKSCHRMRPYELMYLCPPTIDEERIGAVSERIQQTISKLGGKVEQVVPIAKRRLAYEVAHHRDGQYGVVESALPPPHARDHAPTKPRTRDIPRHTAQGRE